jgi:Imelysin
MPSIRQIGSSPVRLACTAYHRSPHSWQAAVLGISLVAAPAGARGDPRRRRRTVQVHLIADVVVRTLASAQTLRASAAAGEVAAAKQAWLDAWVGWERSEVFTGGFVPGLDRAIDAWPELTAKARITPLTPQGC